MDKKRLSIKRFNVTREIIILRRKQGMQDAQIFLPITADFNQNKTTGIQEIVCDVWGDILYEYYINIIQCGFAQDTEIILNSV